MVGEYLDGEGLKGEQDSGIPEEIMELKFDKSPNVSFSDAGEVYTAPPFLSCHDLL